MTALRDAIDTTTLGWIKPELDETLRQARHEIEAFAEDPSDTSRMRFCAGFLHQVHGTLRMVELYAPAMVAEEMERLARALQDGGSTIGDLIAREFRIELTVPMDRDYRPIDEADRPGAGTEVAHAD